MNLHGPSSRAQLRGAVQLTGSGFDRTTALVRDIHRGVADLPFDRLEPLPIVSGASATARALHDAIADAVYGTIRIAGRGAFAAATVALKALEAGDRREAAAPAEEIDHLISLANGIVGDFMAAQRNPLAIRLGFYRDGRPLELTRAGLAAAQPDATERLAIFVHGLCTNERGWAFYVDAADPDTRPYAARLTADFGVTPYWVRYNSGLRVPQNGRLLARAISRLVAAHPRPVSEILLVGHSMGGLVCRAACDAAQRQGATWADKVSHVFCLGSPHRGAPLEKLVHLGSVLMNMFRVSAPIAEFLNVRSRGIQDLRYGYTGDLDHRGRKPRAADAAPMWIAPLPSARYHYIGSSLGRSTIDPLGHIVGDGLVRLPSSAAGDLSNADTTVLFGIGHVRLMNHPAVYRHMHRRLTADRASGA